MEVGHKGFLRIRREQRTKREAQPSGDECHTGDRASGTASRLLHTSTLPWSCRSPKTPPPAPGQARPSPETQGRALPSIKLFPTATVLNQLLFLISCNSCAMSHAVRALIINSFELHIIISHIISKLHDKIKATICFCMVWHTRHSIKPVV